MGAVRSHASGVVYTSWDLGAFATDPLRVSPRDGSSRRRANEEFRNAWRVLVAALFGMLFCCLPRSAIGVFIGPWSRDFGWSLSEISGALVFCGLGAAASGPLIGRLMDRLGARRVVLTYIPILALSVATVSQVGVDLWMLYLLMLLWGVVTPGLGAYANAVSNWFDVGRGTALGLICLGVGVSTAIAPPVAQWIVDHYGWRIGNLCLSAMVLLAWPLAFFWLEEDAPRTDQKVATAEAGYSCREALRTQVFWLLGGSFLLWGCTAGGSVFLIPFLTTQGMSAADAAFCVSMLGLTTVVGLPLMGLTIDRMHAPYVCAAALFVAASAFTVLGLFGRAYALLAVPIIGIAGSAWMSCLDYSTARYFGLRSFGEISALFDRMASIGAMMGPLMFSLVRDATTSYEVPYLAVGMLATVSAICMAMAGWRPFTDRVAR